MKLYDNPGGGRPNKLSSAGMEKLADLLQEEPHSMKQLALQVAQTFNKRIILDNAPQPTSMLFKAQRWEQRELLSKYLPAYLPTLNLIEVLWRFIKFYWLLFSAYRNFAALENALEDILKNISIKYHLTFA